MKAMDKVQINYDQYLKNVEKVNIKINDIIKISIDNLSKADEIYPKLIEDVQHFYFQIHQTLVEQKEKNLKYLEN